MQAHNVEALASDLRNAPQLSRALRDRRRALNLTQEEVADRAGVSQQWLSGFENGKASSGTHRMMRVAAVLGLSLALHERPRTDIDLVFEALASPCDPAMPTEPATGGGAPAEPA